MCTFLKHALVVVQRLQISNDDSTEVRVGGIDQAVILVWGENGRHEKYTALAGGYELITKSSQLGWRSGVPPVLGQVAGFNALSGHVLRNFGNGQNEIGWWIVLI